VTTTAEPEGPTLRVPAPSLVLLVGPAGVGKSTFARRVFPDTAIVSSDRCRAWISDDEDDQTATAEAFALLHDIVEKRLRRNRLTVVDATNLEAPSRRALIARANRHHVLAVAILFDADAGVLGAQIAARVATGARRHIPTDVQVTHLRLLDEARRTLPEEDIAAVFTLSSPQFAAQATVTLDPLPCDRRQEAGPFDLIGDIHGCLGPLVRLLGALGYRVDGGAAGMDWQVTPPPGRRAVFLGDLVDRGPAVPEVLALVRSMVAAGHALAVTGNHDAELLRVMRGGTPRAGFGLEASIRQLARVSSAEASAAAVFLAALPDHLVLDGGRLVAAHAALPPALHGRAGRIVRERALIGEGTRTSAAPPAWVSEYVGDPVICYAHTPVTTPTWINGTINLDTGCVFGGALTALRYPERTLVSVPADR
jgi:protein phosphatase